MNDGDRLLVEASDAYKAATDALQERLNHQAYTIADMRREIRYWHDRCEALDRNLVQFAMATMTPIYIQAPARKPTKVVVNYSDGTTEVVVPK